MAVEEIRVPDIGDFGEVEVIEVLVKPGDTIAAEDSLITLESDKASMEIPATHGGRVTELKVAVGDKVSEGSVIALVQADGAAPQPAAPEAGDGEGDGDDGDTPEAAPAAPASASGGATVEVRVPDIGEFSAVEVIEVLVESGAEVAAEQSLITLESDKASMEMPSRQAGRVS